MSSAIVATRDQGEDAIGSGRSGQWHRPGIDPASGVLNRKGARMVGAAASGRDRGSLPQSVTGRQLGTNLGSFGWIHRMKVLIFGAGFAGLELATALSDEFGDGHEITLIDKSEGFVFGFSKLDVMFGKATPSSVFHPYRDIDKPGLSFVRATVDSIDPAARRVETDVGLFDCDILVVALGAELDPGATPGLIGGCGPLRPSRW